MRKGSLHAVIALFLVLSLAGSAQAHATLKRAMPQAGATLDQAPAAIELTFTEEVEAQFGAITVYDHNGARVDLGDARLDPQNVTRVLAALKSLDDGLYTVSWRVLSADGHPMAGTYGFTVGRGIAGAQYFQPDLPDPAAAPPAGVLAGYWLAVAGLMTATGLALAQGLVARSDGGALYRSLIKVGLGAALIGSVIYLIARTAQVSLGLVTPALLWRLLLTDAGKALLARLLLLAVVLPWVGRRWWLVVAAGALGLLTFPLSGHASAVEPATAAVALDWLHLLAGAAWLGGLLHLLLIAPGGAVPLGESVRRFSLIAGASVLLLIGTGLYPALLHVPSLKALLGTLYGLTLRTKLLTFGALVALGAVNLVIIGPQLRQGKPLAAGWLRRLVGAELALLALVLGASALLTNVAPARVALPPEALSVGLHTRDYAATFRMNPLAPGYRALDVVLEAHAGSLEPETQVDLELGMAGQTVGRSVVAGRPLGDGQYRFENLLLGMPGDWLFELKIRRPGAEVQTVKLDVAVPEAP